MNRALTINHHDLKRSVSKQLCLFQLKETFTCQLQDQHFWFVMPCMAIWIKHWRPFGAIHVHWDTWSQDFCSGVPLKVSTLIFFNFLKKAQSQHWKTYLELSHNPKMIYMMHFSMSRFILYFKDFCLSHVLSNCFVCSMSCDWHHWEISTKQTNDYGFILLEQYVILFITQRSFSQWRAIDILATAGLHSCVCGHLLLTFYWTGCQTLVEL